MFGTNKLTKHFSQSIRILRNSQYSVQIDNVRHNSQLLVDTDEKTGYATISLNRPPVNSLNLEFLLQITKSLTELENDKCKGIVITTENKSIFSAGLDLFEMYEPEEKRLREFWSSFQDMWLKMYTMKIPMGAAISGHAPAGGALIAICSDYRVMVQGKYTIGLNEAKVGIVAPFWLMDSFTNTVGFREAEFGLTTGKMYTVDEALNIGLIDEIAQDKEDAIAKCTKVLEDLNKCVPFARHASKLALRKPTIDRFTSGRVADVDTFVQFVMNPAIQKAIGMYVESLKKKK